MHNVNRYEAKYWWKHYTYWFVVDVVSVNGVGDTSVIDVLVVSTDAIPAVGVEGDVSWVGFIGVDVTVVDVTVVFEPSPKNIGVILLTGGLITSGANKISWISIFKKH